MNYTIELINGKTILVKSDIITLRVFTESIVNGGLEDKKYEQPFAILETIDNGKIAILVANIVSITVPKTPISL